MNEILAKLEKMPIVDLTYLFEYLVGLINERKRAEREGLTAKMPQALQTANGGAFNASAARERKRAEREVSQRKRLCKQRNLEHKGNLITNSRQECSSVRGVED